MIAVNRYSDLIQPESQEVQQVVTEISSVMRSLPGASLNPILAVALAHFMESFEFVDFRGRMSVEETVRSRHGNCIALSCLLASALKSLVNTPTDIVVFIGCRILQPARLHAYVLTRGQKPGRITVVDPQFMKALDYSLQGLMDRFRIYVVFDEQREETDHDRISAWLSDLASAPDWKNGHEQKLNQKIESTEEYGRG